MHTETFEVIARGPAPQALAPLRRRRRFRTDHTYASTILAQLHAAFEHFNEGPPALEPEDELAARVQAATG